MLDSFWNRTCKFKETLLNFRYMMKSKAFLVLLLALLAFSTIDAQPLRDINYSYEYDVETQQSFIIKPVRQPHGWTIFYELQLSDTTYRISDFSVQWETRADLIDKSGVPQTSGITILKSSDTKLVGKLELESALTPFVVVAKVLNKTKNQLWLYHKILQPNYSVNGYLQSADGAIIFKPFVSTKQVVTVKGFDADQRLFVSYYDDEFPSAVPAFSEGQARVSQKIKPDSAFQVMNEQAITFSKKGMYLIQKDTSAVESVAFRAEEDYPKFRKLEDLVGPFVYVCTKEEFHNLRVAGEDKKKFDKGILSITRDVERAKEFMKTYFNRVEAANRYFTSYKQGWKTDRGMIYLVYGAPHSVFKFADREVWSYGKVDFTFIRSSTLFDPENYVLVRDKKVTDDWYEKVDLLRNSRF